MLLFGFNWNQAKNMTSNNPVCHLHPPVSPPSTGQHYETTSDCQPWKLKSEMWTSSLSAQSEDTVGEGVIVASELAVD